MASREANLIGYLSPEKGNLWRLLYETMHTLIQKYWKFAHNYAVQYSHTNNEYYSWDKFVEELETLDIGDVNWAPPIDFDPRFCYYSSNVNLVEPLSTEEGRRTTEEAEIAKTGPYGMNEFPTLETKLIPEESELERGKKRGLEGAILPPPHKGRKGSVRGSSVPPGSATALARQRAEATRLRDPKGKGFAKGTPKGKGKASEGAAVGKLPPTFVPRSSTEGKSDMPIADRRNMVKNRALYDRTWELLQKILIDFGTTMSNLMAFEYTYVHWFHQLEVT